MSARSKSSDRAAGSAAAAAAGAAAAAEQEAVDRPFAPEIAARARKLAESYQIVMVHEDGRWFGHGLELPNVFGDGRTPAKCVAATREALTAAVATMLEAGQTPPVPARQGVRCEQVNVRLTAEERALLETAAKQKGFRGLSDFIRAGALAFTK